MRVYEVLSNFISNGIEFKNVIASTIFVRDDVGDKKVTGIMYVRIPSGDNIYRVEGEEEKRTFPLIFVDDTIVNDMIAILHSSSAGYNRQNYTYRRVDLF